MVKLRVYFGRHLARELFQPVQADQIVYLTNIATYSLEGTLHLHEYGLITLISVNRNSNQNIFQIGMGSERIRDGPLDGRHGNEIRLDQSNPVVRQCDGKIRTNECKRSAIDDIEAFGHTGERDGFHVSPSGH